MPLQITSMEQLKKNLKAAQADRGNYNFEYTADMVAHDQALTLKWMEEHPDFQTFYVLDEKTGKQPYIAPIIPAATNTGLMFPPVVLADGYLYTLFSARSLFMNSWPDLGGKFDLEKGRIIERSRYGNTRDQTQAYSS